MNEDLKGYLVDKVEYRGESIFTIYISKGDSKLGINLLDCFALDVEAIIGKVIENYSVSNHLNMKHIFHCQQLNLDQKDFQSIWIQTIDENQEKYEMLGAFKNIVIDSNLHLYNPISEDKY